MSNEIISLPKINEKLKEKLIEVDFNFQPHPNPELVIVQEWFRKVHKIKVDAKHATSNGTYKYTIWKWNYDNTVGDWERIGNFNSYVYIDEALMQGLLDACDLISLENGNE
jgi:hypothetical protein